jgi:hypothetical protein
VNRFVLGTLSKLPSRVGRGCRTSLAVTRYIVLFAMAVARPHGFAVPAAGVHRSMPYRLLPSHQRQWNRLYGRHPSAPRLPFSYCVRVTSTVFFDVLRSLGINFRHLLYLRHQVRVLPGYRTHFECGADYVVTAGLREIIPLDRNRVVSVFDGVLARADDATPIMRMRDSFLVRNIPDAALAQLAASPLLRHDTTGEFTALSNRQPQLAAGAPHECAFLRYPANAGWRFGLVSGDLNLVHINKTVARLFGHQRPFAQGLFTANHVIATLTEHRGRAIEELAITFCRPVLLPQTARLVFDDTRHELSDAEGHLLACGTYRFGDGGVGADARDQSGFSLPLGSRR